MSHTIDGSAMRYLHRLPGRSILTCADLRQAIEDLSRLPGAALTSTNGSVLAFEIRQQPVAALPELDMFFYIELREVNEKLPCSCDIDIIDRLLRWADANPDAFGLEVAEFLESYVEILRLDRVQ